MAVAALMTEAGEGLTSRVEAAGAPRGGGTATATQRTHTRPARPGRPGAGSTRTTASAASLTR